MASLLKRRSRKATGLRPIIKIGYGSGVAGLSKYLQMLDHARCIQVKH